jgi:multidrug resistance efflux pump
LQVLALITTLKETNQDQGAILERLRAMQGDGWQGLPDLPAEWGSARATMPVDLAASRASELAQIAVLQTELQHTRAALTSALAERDSLKAELAVLQAAEVGHTEQLHALELLLREAEGRIASLQARLGQYSLNDRPIPLVLLIAFTALAVLVTVLLVLPFRGCFCRG